MPVSLSELAIRAGKGKPAEALTPPPVKKQPAFLHVTVLIAPEDIQRADQLYEAKGFRTRHQMLQWLILYGLKNLENGRISPRTQSTTVVEVSKP